MQTNRTIQQIQEESSAIYQKSHETISNLSSLLKTFTESTYFDAEDVREVKNEMERLNNEEVKRYRQYNIQRLATLKQFDDIMDFKTNHPVLNDYLCKKQGQVMKLCDQYSSAQYAKKQDQMSQQYDK
jgi:hypothetical protein